MLLSLPRFCVHILLCTPKFALILPWYLSLSGCHLDIILYITKFARILSVCCIVYYQVCVDMFLCINKFTWMIPRFLLCIPKFAWMLLGYCIVLSEVCLDVAWMLYCVAWMMPEHCIVYFEVYFVLLSLPGRCLDILLCISKFSWMLPGYFIVYS